MFFLASAVAFDALVAAVPFALLVLGGAGYVLHQFGTSSADIHQLLDEFLPAHGSGGDDPFSNFETIAATIAANRGRLSIWGAPLFLWLASRFYGTVRYTLNQVFEAPERRPFLLGIATELLLVVATAVLFVANGLITAQAFVGGWAGRFLALLSAFGFSVVLFAMVYRVAPARRLPWHTVVVASLVASLAFELAKKLFALYLAGFATMDRFVSNTNVIALLLFIAWLYYMACAFLLGAEVGGAYDAVVRERERGEPRTSAVGLGRVDL